MSTDGSMRSRALDLLRFPLAVIIVFIHVCATRKVFVGDGVIDVSAFPYADTFFLLVDAFLREQSVPVYYFIAGYVFFLGVDFNLKTYGKKLRNRIHSLLIPYLCWNAIALGLDFLMFLPALGEYFPQTADFRFNISVEGLLSSFWDSWNGLISRVRPEPADNYTYPADFPLWFVRDLMMIVVATPAIFLLMKRAGRYFIAVAGCVWIVSTYFHLGHFAQLSNGLFFFSWGGYMSYRHHDMIADFSRYLRYSLPAYILLALLYMAAAKSWPAALVPIKCMSVFAGMIAAYGASAWLIRRCNVSPGSFLPAASFFIYAGHGAFVDYLNILLFRIMRPEGLAGAIGVYLSSLLLTVGSLLFIFFILGRWIRPVQKLLAGRCWPGRVK